MRSDYLIQKAQAIQRNIDKYGWKRYDLRDTRWISFMLRKDKISKIIRKVVLLLEEFFPIIVRKILRVEKKCWPTTYSFVGNAYLTAEKNNIYFGQTLKSIDIANKCIDEFIIDKNNVNTWWGDKPHIGFGGKVTKDVKDKRPTLLMHALTRCNIFLLNVGKEYNVDEYIEIAYKSALMVMEHYEIIDFNNGTKSISYFYNTKDCTININSEFSHWLSMLPNEKHTPETKDMLNCMIKLIIKEQNEDGSWFYFSKWHIKEYSERSTCDCHHTATVIFNLLNIIKCSYIDLELKKNIINSINKGMRFFITNFFDKER